MADPDIGTKIHLPRPAWAVAFLTLLAGGCVASADNSETSDSAELAGYAVPARVRVNGVVVDVEANYLPRVVQCENPGAPYEAMKAQAVAARTYLAYRAAGRSLPSIVDGESDQVYTCAANLQGRFVSADALNAVKETAGQVVLVNGNLTAGFFVAGAIRADGSCRKLSDPTGTEHYVTYNYGRSGSNVKASSIGSMMNSANHGCLAQNMANCLADSTSFKYRALLRYFYGSDAQIAKMSAPSLADSDVVNQVALDVLDATCYSTSFARPVSLGACVQTTATGRFMQCGRDGRFASTSSSASGLREGLEGPCTDELTY